jgi:hypothetical protein
LVDGRAPNEKHPKKTDMRHKKRTPISRAFQLIGEYFPRPNSLLLSGKNKKPVLPRRIAHLS